MLPCKQKQQPKQYGTTQCKIIQKEYTEQAMHRTYPPALPGVPDDPPKTRERGQHWSCALGSGLRELSKSICGRLFVLPLPLRAVTTQTCSCWGFRLRLIPQRAYFRFGGSGKNPKPSCFPAIWGSFFRGSWNPLAGGFFPCWPIFFLFGAGRGSQTRSNQPALSSLRFRRMTSLRDQVPDRTV